MLNPRSVLKIGLSGAIVLTLLNAPPADALPGGALCAKSAIYKVEGDVQAPVRISGDRPAYPEEARKERIEGMVVVLAVIDREGLVESVEVVEEKSTTERQDLRQAAIDAVKEWTFEPATLEGEPVAVYYQLTINFRLTKDGKK